MSRHPFRYIYDAYDDDLEDSQSSQVISLFVKFLEDNHVLDSCTDFNTLFSLIKLASWIEYENLYFEAYLSVLRIFPEFDHMPPLHNYHYSEKEV